MNQSAAAEFTGVPQQTISRWCSNGVVRPNAARGRGAPADLTPDDVMAILTIEELRKQGATFQKIKRAVRALREMYGQEWPYRWLMVTAEGVVVWIDDKNTVRAPDGQTFWADIAGIRERVMEELQKRERTNEVETVKS